MLDILKASAEEVGINLFITNSKEKIETQLNRLTKEEDLPIILISWDIDVSVTFTNGFLDNPTMSIVALLLTKPEDLKKQTSQDAANDMAILLQKLLQKLNTNLAAINKSPNVSPITNATYKMVPVHGYSKHSGVLARWNMIGPINNLNCE